MAQLQAVCAEWSGTVPGMKNWDCSQAVPTRENGKSCEVAELGWSVEELWGAACFPRCFQKRREFIATKQSEQ